MATLPPAFPPAPPLPGAAAPLPPLPQPAGIPFENGPGIGSFFATVRGFLTRPVETMAMQRAGEGLFAALTYFLIIQIPAQFVGQLLNFALRTALSKVVPPPPPPPGLPPALARFVEMNNHPTLAFTLLLAVVAVILGFGFLLINAALIQSAMRLLGGGREGYGSTLKALCYSVTPLAFALVPICGSLAGGIWTLVLHFLLVGPAHREPVSKGAMAVLIYYLVVACCVGIAAIGFAFSIAALATGMRGG